MPLRTVLVTGMSGLIGSALRRHLTGKYELSALNRRSIPGVTCYQADIADLAAIAPAFDGIDTVVHLAARTGSSDVFDEILRANVVGTYNVFEAARRAGVGRVIYASSGATVSAWERDPPWNALVAGRYDEAGAWKKMTHETPTRPSGLYGASKIWGEAIARHYADAHGLSAICVRIGRVKSEDRPLSMRDYTVWCSQRDVVRMIELCIAAPPTLRFDVFFAVSDNRWGYRDLEHARAVLGFEPRDRAEDHR
jgi:NAD+ dependent glucose-6-phosphate dehydrogenase